MISFDEAIELIRRTVTPLEVESVALDAASGRVLASPVAAGLDSPRADVSAMDGYAVREGDLTAFPARLAVVGESFAGAGWNGTLNAGQCARIFTGAPVPDGADRIIIQEAVRRDGDVAIIDDHPGKARHIRKRGDDFKAGDTLLTPGRFLDPRAIIAAAAADQPQLEVYRRPSVRILATGDELTEPGSAATFVGTIPESVSFGVAALARDWGAQILGRTRLRDELNSMVDAAVTATESADVVVVTGGASVGERDFAKSMFEPVGLELIFSKLSIKPGKPVWLGRVGNAFVMGLPGNPTSAFVTARLLLAPLIAALSGRAADDALAWRSARLSAPLAASGPRESFFRGQWVGGKVTLIGFQDSSAQKVLADADVLIRQTADSPVIPAGEEVPILPL